MLTIGWNRGATYRGIARALVRAAIFLWARQDGPWGPKRPLGIPGDRDPDHPCTSYAPRRWKPGDFRDCLSDGHYLCKGCCHFDAEGFARLNGHDEDDSEEQAA